MTEQERRRPGRKSLAPPGMLSRHKALQQYTTTAAVIARLEQASVLTPVDQEGVRYYLVGELEAAYRC